MREVYGSVYDVLGGIMRIREYWGRCEIHFSFRLLPGLGTKIGIKGCKRYMDGKIDTISGFSGAWKTVVFLECVG